MKYLPDTNAWITYLRGKNRTLADLWHEHDVSDICLCSVVAYELRYGAEGAREPLHAHEHLNGFLAPYLSLTFDDACAVRCAKLRRTLERAGKVIGPYDLQIAAVALEHGLTLVTHNTREFERVPDLQLQDWET